jgi:TRAP-type C4-dicarboxylate transport system permease small subunit
VERGNYSSFHLANWENVVRGIALTKFLDRVDVVLRHSVGVILCVMTLSVTWQVVLRYLFKRPNMWSEEVARFLFVWLVMFGSALAIRYNRHMSIDFIKQKLPVKFQLVLSIVLTVLCMVFVSFIGWQGLKLLSITSRQLSGGLRIPMVYPYLSIPVGSILMLIFFVEYLANLLRADRKER